MHLTEGVSRGGVADLSADAPVARWPPKVDLFGVGISVTSYESATGAILAAAHRRVGGCVSALAVHGVMTAVHDPSFASIVNRFEIVAPDGQPVKMAINRLHRAGLPDRVYGPELMLRVCERAAREDVGVYLYGSATPVVTALAERLHARIPSLRIVGCEPSLFRPLTSAEDAALLQRIERSGAGVIFLGLGCPLQERFASSHRDRLDAVQLCVGAAFDFHAGMKPMAPPWMQRAALEWLFRLIHEPRRLWKRYALTNSAFILRFARELLSTGSARGVTNDVNRPGRAG